jgi:hypothetical protein
VDALHAVVTCSNNGAGQSVCTSSAGFLAGFGFLILIYLAFLVIGVVAAVKIVTKAGFSGWWVLIAFVPFVGAVFVLVFAFTTWPVTREVQRLRAQVAGTWGYGGGPSAYGVPPSYGGPPPYGGPSPSAGFAPPGPMQPAEPTPLPTFGQFISGATAPQASAIPEGPAASEVSAPPEESAPEPGHPPAGWFPSPGGPPGQLRYWDGSGWTDNYS